MLILGLETSCDETSAALLSREKGRLKILSNVVSSQVKIHRRYKGIVPEVAARLHLEKILPVIKEAIVEIKNLQKIDLIAVTFGPGLITSLLVGVEAAKTLSYLFKKPLIPINHLEGHIYANFINEQSIRFPAVCLVVSGGHTELVLMKDLSQYQKLGSTRDDAAGECFDKVAKLLNLGYPGGPAIEKTAQAFQRDSPFSLNLPRPMIGTHDFDFSFSGLKTAVLYKIKGMKIDKNFKEALAYETQEAIIDVLATKTARASREFKAKSIILSGGVAANERLRVMMKEKAEKSGKKLFVPPKNLCTDNAAMIAAAGYFRYHLLNKKQRLDLLNNWRKIKVDPNLML